MRLDFFQILDSAVRGFILYFYGILAALAVLIWWPRSGPIRLQERYLRGERSHKGLFRLRHRLTLPENRVVAGVTLLFLAFLLFMGIALGTVEWRKQLSNLLSNPLSSEELWPAIAGALVSTIVADLLLRLLLWWALPQRLVRRRLVHGALQYSLSLFLLIAVLVPLVLERYLGSGSDVVFYALLVTLLAAIGPSAVIFTGTTRRRRSLTRTWWESLVRGAVLLMVMLGAILVGLWAFILLSEAEPPQPEAKPDLRVSALRCMLLRPQAYVDLRLDNRGTAPAVLYLDNAWLFLSGPGPKSEPLPLIGDFGAGQPIIIRPGEIQVTRVAIENRRLPPLQFPVTRCQVKVVGVDVAFTAESNERRVE